MQPSRSVNFNGRPMIQQYQSVPHQMTPQPQSQFPLNCPPQQVFLQQFSQGRTIQNIQPISSYPQMITSPSIHQFAQPFNLALRENLTSSREQIMRQRGSIQERPDGLEVDFLKNQDDFSSYLESFADKDNYFCQICHNLLWEPISCMKCAKMYCKGCLFHWIDQCQSCPTCRERFEVKKVDKSIINNLSKLLFSCYSASTGCTEFIGYENLLKHEQTCSFKVVNCKNVGCDFKAIRKEMIQHDTQCPHFLQNCQWCNKPIKRIDSTDHEESCEMKILGCENMGCSQSMTRTEMNKHIIICPYNIVRCEMCKEEFKLKEIEGHSKECDFLIVNCRGCKQTMFKKQLSVHEETCELVELQCPDCTSVIARKDLEQHDQISCLKMGQKLLFESKNQLLCENTCLKQDIENLKQCIASLYTQIQEIDSGRRNSFQKILRVHQFD